MVRCADCHQSRYLPPSKCEGAIRPTRCNACNRAHRKATAVLYEYQCVECGRIRLARKRRSIRLLCLSCKNKGHRNHSWIGGSVAISCCKCGKEKTVSNSRAKRHRRADGRYFCRSCAMQHKPTGSANPAWRGGTSFAPYPTEWTPALRRTIRQRDKCCAVCSSVARLAVHHINYNKSDLSLANLIALCNSCHAKTNFSRSRWQVRLTEIMEARLGHANA